MHELIREHFPFLGERAATESELIDFCRDRLTLIYSDITTGCYVRPKNEESHYIFIGNNESSFRRQVLAHEIGHYLAHSQPHKKPTSKTEREAKLTERLLIGDFANVF